MPTGYFSVCYWQLRHYNGQSVAETGMDRALRLATHNYYPFLVMTNWFALVFRRPVKGTANPPRKTALAVHRVGLCGHVGCALIPVFPERIPFYTGSLCPLQPLRMLELRSGLFTVRIQVQLWRGLPLFPVLGV